MEDRDNNMDNRTDDMQKFSDLIEHGKSKYECMCGNTDSNFFALDPKIVPKLGNLRFCNSKTGRNGLVKAW
jgi:hypothetical protein